MRCTMLVGASQTRAHAYCNDMALHPTGDNMAIAQVNYNLRVSKAWQLLAMWC